MALTHVVVFSALPDRAWLAWMACGSCHKYLVKSPKDIMKQLHASGRQRVHDCLGHLLFPSGMCWWCAPQKQQKTKTQALFCQGLLTATSFVLGLFYVAVPFSFYSFCSKKVQQLTCNFNSVHCETEIKLYQHHAASSIPTCRQDSSYATCDWSSLKRYESLLPLLLSFATRAGFCGFLSSSSASHNLSIRFASSSLSHRRTTGM